MRIAAEALNSAGYEFRYQSLAKEQDVEELAAAEEEHVLGNDDEFPVEAHSVFGPVTSNLLNIYAFGGATEGILTGFNISVKSKTKVTLGKLGDAGEELGLQPDSDYHVQLVKVVTNPHAIETCVDVWT